jgi:CRISPR type III-A-associated protein Csm2
MDNNRNFHGNNSYGNRNPVTVKPYVKIGGFYADEVNKTVKKDLFGTKANEIAECLVGISGTQLRRIYDEVKRFELYLTQENWTNHHPYILMIKSKTRYAVARATKNRIEGAYKNFYDFINEGLSLINEKKDYHVFLALFEAVYGFSYEKLRDN